MNGLESFRVLPGYKVFLLLKIAINAGVDILVSGTTIFKSNKGNIKKNMNRLIDHLKQ